MALGFIVVILATTEIVTSNYLKSSTPYRHSLELVQRSPEVQALIGVPVKPGLTVSSKRNMAYFKLSYVISGPDGSATVEVTTVSSLKSATMLQLQVSTPERTLVLVRNVDPTLAVDPSE